MPFMSSSPLDLSFNNGTLTLIPKKQNANRIADFRPISCCNTVYKAVSKLLAERLKQTLPLIISNSQSVFIPGRLLVENVLMATELIQGYNWKKISKGSMLKVDLKKDPSGSGIPRSLCESDLPMHLYNSLLSGHKWRIVWLL